MHLSNPTKCRQLTTMTHVKTLRNIYVKRAMSDYLSSANISIPKAKVSFYCIWIANFAPWILSVNVQRSYNSKIQYCSDTYGLSGKLKSGVMDRQKGGGLYIRIRNPVKTRRKTMVSSDLKNLNLNDLPTTVDS